MITMEIPREVVQLMAEGLSTAEIAEQLDLELGQVRDYVRQVVVRYGGGSRTRGILAAYEQDRGEEAAP
jgi:DNA-binding NarL/FixJ family response regulator